MVQASPHPDDPVRPGGAPALTDRELQVLRYLPTRLSIGAIAARLGISENTVKTHVKGIYRKLGVRARNEAIDAAVHAGLLEVQPLP